MHTFYTCKGLEAGRTLEEEDSLDLLDNGKRERRSSFVVALVLAIAVSVLAAPVVEAAVTTIKGTVKIKDSTGDGIESQALSEAGAAGLEAGGSSGAVAVRTFGGGNSFGGAGDCTATPTQTDPLTNVVTIPGGNVITGVILTGDDMNVRVTAQAVGAGQLPLLNFQTTPENPNTTLSLGNGLIATDNVTFTCTAGSGNFVVIVQDWNP